jgi:hypothetical protein
MVHKIQLPKKLIVYPKGYGGEKLAGFMTPEFPREVFARTPSRVISDPVQAGYTATHETMHQIWRKLSDKEKLMFMKKMGKVEKLPSKLKFYKPFLKEAKRYFMGKVTPREKPAKIVTAVEAFPRMGEKWVWSED